MRNQNTFPCMPLIGNQKFYQVFDDVTQVIAWTVGPFRACAIIQLFKSRCLQVTLADEAKTNYMIRQSYFCHDLITVPLRKWQVIWRIRLDSESFRWQTSNKPDIPVNSPFVEVRPALILFPLIHFPAP